MPNNCEGSCGRLLWAIASGCVHVSNSAINHGLSGSEACDTQSDSAWKLDSIGSVEQFIECLLSASESIIRSQRLICGVLANVT